MPEYVRAISQRRLADRPLGVATPQTLQEVQRWISDFTTDLS